MPQKSIKIKIYVQSADNITVNQQEVLVKDFFNTHSKKLKSKIEWLK
jgi:hypothetical protein